MSIMVLTVFIKPITLFMNSDLEFDIFNDGQSIVLQNEYLEYVAKNKINSYKDICTKILEDNGILNGDVYFEYVFNQENFIEITKVYLNLSKAVIISDKEHIDIINKIKNEISKNIFLKLNGVEFVIYE